MKKINILIITIFIIFQFRYTVAQSGNIADSSQNATDNQILQERLSKADLIIEGKVIKQKGFWNKTYTSIFTSNTVVVYKLFKGQLSSDTIEVVGRGGVLADDDTLANTARGLSVGNEFPLRLNEEGIFFIRNNTWDVQMKEAPNSFVMWDKYRIEYLYFYQHVRPFPLAVFNSLHFKDIPEVYSLLNKALGKPYKVITKNPRDEAKQK